MITINRIQKIGSFFIPIKVWKGSSRVNPVLELFSFRGEWWLGTDDALYSTGTRYKPLLVAFYSIKGFLDTVQNVLVLGSGLGSAPAILSSMGHRPHVTLVDIDEVVIDLARDLMDPKLKDDITYVVEDAEVFMRVNRQKYDVLVIDIFNSRAVPEFVSGIGFLEACKRSLNPSGYVVANYMINSADDWTKLLANFKIVFPSVSVTELGMNRILRAKV